MFYRSYIDQFLAYILLLSLYSNLGCDKRKEDYYIALVISFISQAFQQFFFSLSSYSKNQMEKLNSFPHKKREK